MKNCRRTNQRNHVIISSRSCTRYGIFLLLFSKSANKFLKCVFNAETKHLSGFYDSSLIRGRVKTVERLKTKSDLINFVLFFSLRSTESENSDSVCSLNSQSSILFVSQFRLLVNIELGRILFYFRHCER